MKRAVLHVLPNSLEKLTVALDLGVSRNDDVSQFVWEFGFVSLRFGSRLERLLGVLNLLGSRHLL